MVYATSEFDVGKVNSLHQPLKPYAVFKTQRASEIPVHLQNKVNRFLDNLEEYDINSSVNKEEQPKRNIFNYPLNILDKRRTIKKCSRF